ncbi:MAG: class IV adenylate cyclase [Deltaproteobacteria bacterium]|nr:class IV adenylate cyclase [Deltaproteobacteria bacterium]
MNDPVEIEVKFYLHDVNSVRERVLSMGAAFSGRFFETNICFEDAAKSFKNQDILLRLRKDDKARLTFKSPPDHPDRDFKIYRELEIEVDDFDTCRAVLEGIGFHPEQTYEKWRETFILADTKLLIDTTPYGVFLEIEGQKSDILDITNRLDLKWEERILLNYLEIFEIIRREEALSFSDMTFDNFRSAPADIGRYLPLLYAA